MQKAKTKSVAKNKKGRKKLEEKKPATLLRGDVAKGGSSSGKKTKVT
ncbi:MAG: hypothetical protein JST63_20670 [Bacteroidetes bacterium]|nr:hypothetical protein [Bacteroidota bacterium]